jgi:threonine/homoserine/homoserine lactone efflux protein
VETGQASVRPMRFVKASAFQLVNPKGWVMAISAMAVYTNPDRYAFSVLLVTVIFVAIGAPAISLWTGMGVGLRRFLDRPKVLGAFNWTMAILLVASLWPMLR